MKRESGLKTSWTCSTVLAWIVVQLVIGCAPWRSSAQITVPNFSIIGQSPRSSTEIWKNWEANITPRQIAIDYTTNKSVYGITCEYASDTNIFRLLKGAIEDEFQVRAKVDQSRFCLWRSEQRKLTITLEDDSENKCIRLIAVSVDKNIRKSGSAGRSDLNGA